MYRWIVYLHVLLAFAFLMLHGVSALAHVHYRNRSGPILSLMMFKPF